MNLVRSTFEKLPCQCFGELGPRTCTIIIPWQLEHASRSSSIHIVITKMHLLLLTATRSVISFFLLYWAQLPSLPLVTLDGLLSSLLVWATGK